MAHNTDGRFARWLCRRWPFLPQSNRFAKLVGAPRAMPASPVVVGTRWGTVVRVDSDEIFRRVYTFGDYEPFLTRVFDRIVRPGDVVVDVGASFGWYSALFGRRVGPTGRVIAVEPIRAIYARLLDTLERNGPLPQVTPLNVALGEAPGELLVNTFTDLGIGYSSVAHTDRADAVPNRCPMLTLDQLVAEQRLPRVDFVKADVEGFEREVYRGAAELLSRPDAPIVHFEFNRDCVRSRNLDPRELFAMLRQYGYADFRIADSRMGVVPRDEWVDQSSCDFLAAKPHDTARLDRARVNRFFYGRNWGGPVEVA